MLGRRDFFRAAALAVATAAEACGGAATIAAALPAGPRKADLYLLRINTDTTGVVRLTPIRWMDQRPGDNILGIWEECQKHEQWTVTGMPYLTSNEHGPSIPTVKIDHLRIIGEPQKGDKILIDPMTLNVNVVRDGVVLPVAYEEWLPDNSV